MHKINSHVVIIVIVWAIKCNSMIHHAIVMFTRRDNYTIKYRCGIHDPE